MAGLKVKGETAIVRPRNAAIEWANQQLVFSEAVRGGPMVWLAGEDRLHGDPLGPVRHAHDDATEYYYVFRGQCLVEVSGKEQIAREGDLVYIPPDTPHNLFGVNGVDAWMFILVAPNRIHNKWRTSNYLPGRENLEMAISRPFEGNAAASAYPFAATALRLDRDYSLSLLSEMSEQLFLVRRGRVHGRVGLLAGNLDPGDYIHVRRGVGCHLSSLGPTADLLRFDCPFKPYTGVDLGFGVKSE